jgi:hypothetical protein
MSLNSHDDTLQQRTRSADCAMIAALFDIVENASKRRVLCVLFRWL